MQNVEKEIGLSRVYSTPELHTPCCFQFYLQSKVIAENRIGHRHADELEFNGLPGSSYQNNEEQEKFVH
jgi:hypothetical protein